MAPRKERSRHRFQREAQRQGHPLAWIPLTLGLAVSAYLSTLVFAGTSGYCVAGTGCDVVQHSVYSRLMGIPIAYLGVAFFGAALAISLSPSPPGHAGLRILAGVAVGASVVFIVLQVGAIRALCPYCLLAEASALTFASLTLARSDRSGRVTTGVVALVTIVVLAAGYFHSSRPSTVASTYAAGLARHLADHGVVFYGAFWCPHCAEQKALFGSAAKLLPYVECDPSRPNAQPERCRAAGIRVYPTWDFNGHLVEGVLSIAELARRSGYPPP